jgi:hypothetical protein
MADPLSLVKQVLQQVADQLERDDALTGDGERCPERLLATGHGNRLAQMILTEDSPDEADEFAASSNSQRGSGATAVYRLFGSERGAVGS